MVDKRSCVASGDLLFVLVAVSDDDDGPVDHIDTRIGGRSHVRREHDAVVVLESAEGRLVEQLLLKSC